MDAALMYRAMCEEVLSFPKIPSGRTRPYNSKT